MMNEGLEALATLASTSQPSPAQGNSGSHNSSLTTDGNSFSGHGSNGNTTASTWSGSTAAAPAGSHPSFSAPNLMQMLQNGNFSQLQQALQQGGNGMNPSALPNSNLALLMGMQQRQPQPQADPLALLQQQLSYYRNNTNNQSGNNMNNQSGNNMNSQSGNQMAAGIGDSTSHEPHQAMALAFQAHQAHQRAQQNDGSQPSGRRTQVLPSPKYQAPMNDPASMACAASSSMPPPKWAAAAPIVVSTLGVPSPPWPAEITPQPSTTGSVPGKEETPFEYLTHSQKAQKRAANRRSAQLSRKRKKQCVEELQEENDDLRRKEQILKSIPDLIVVFDSAGKVCFVSDSVSTFLNMTAKELEGTSFWNRLCEDSVRLLKAAFMDSLAAREPEADTVSLGSGVWELRLVDKDGSHTIVTLNGVVHFAGDRPECVCSMRPVVAKAANSSNTALETVDEPKDFTVRHHVKSEQSVVSSGSSTRKHKRRAVTSSNSSTDDSDSGSSDGMIQS